MKNESQPRAHTRQATRRVLPGQVLTQREAVQSPEPLGNEPFEHLNNPIRDVDLTSLVTRVIKESSAVPCQRSNKNGLAKPKRRRRKRRGGWQPSSHLNWRRDVRVIDDHVHELSKGAYPLTHFVSITPYAANPVANKRTISRVVAHLGQDLKRHGHPHVGITIIEHPIDRDLHGHHLLHVPRSERARIARFRSPQADTLVKPITEPKGLLRYLLKERQRLSPAFEASIRARKGPRWQKCRPVPGRRWSITTDAEDLLAGSLSMRPPKKRIRKRKSHSIAT